LWCDVAARQRISRQCIGAAKIRSSGRLPWEQGRGPPIFQSGQTV